MASTKPKGKVGFGDLRNAKLPLLTGLVGPQVLEKLVGTDTRGTIELVYSICPFGVQALGRNQFTINGFHI